MSFYIWEQENIPAVKVGMSWNPEKRIKSTDHWFKPNFIRIYQITNSYNLTLKDLDKLIKDKFKHLNMKNNSTATEFYNKQIVEELDHFFCSLKTGNYIDYTKFTTLNEYLNNKVDLDYHIEYDLKYEDSSYEE